MSTGYTSPVESGEVTDLRTFTLCCARAFGACIMQRDDPMDAPLTPDEPTDYHTNSLAEAERKMAEVKAWTDEQWAQAADAEMVQAATANEQRRIETAKKRSRYEAMLAHVMAWTPPTEDHVGLKEFMKKQLTESIDHDCFEYTQTQPPQGDAFKAKTLEGLAHDIAYHTEEHRKELERVESRNAWKRVLLDSFNNA